MSDPFVAEIRLFAGDFAPTGWAFCNGQLLSIAQNTALFSLLGTTYGGNGQTNFALPNLQGRVPIHHGQGPGLTYRQPGETGGADTVMLSPNELPSHDHTLAVSAFNGLGSTTEPGNNHLAVPLSGATTAKSYHSSSDTNMVVGNQGAIQPHNNRQPYLAVNFIIAVEGVFPPS